MLSVLRAGFASRLRDDPGRFSLLIPMAVGALGLPVKFADAIAGKLAPGLAVACGIVVGAYAAAAGTTIHALFLALTGRLLGGEGRIVELRAAAAWASLPLVLAAACKVLAVPLLGSPGLEVAPRLAPGSAMADSVSLLIDGIEVTCTVAAFALGVAFVAEAHRISAWRALGTEVLAWVAALLALAAVGAMLP